MSKARLLPIGVLAVVCLSSLGAVGWVWGLFFLRSPVVYANALWIGDAEYKLDSGELRPVSNGPVVRLPAVSTLYNRSADTFSWRATSQKEVSLFRSSASAVVLGVVSLPGHPQVLLVGRVQQGRQTGGVADIKDLSSDFVRQASLLLDRSRAQGWLSIRDLFELGGFDGNWSRDWNDFGKLIDGTLRIASAREFKLIYDQCEAGKCSISALRQAAKHYYADAAARPYVDMDEYLMVSMLSGVPASEAKSKQDGEWRFDDCGIGEYYLGHGVEALLTPSLYDYLSGASGEKSIICISRSDGAAFSPEEILMSWYGEQEAARQVEVVAFRGSNSTSLGLFDLGPPVEISDYYFSLLRVDSAQRFDKFMLRWAGGGSQDRFLIRAVTVGDGLVRPGDGSLLGEWAEDRGHAIKYGIGLKKLAGRYLFGLEAAAEFMREQPTLHCGNFALLFASTLEKERKWRAVSLRSYDKRIHVVVEVDSSITIDPSLGVSYPCGIASMVDGSCAYADAVRLRVANPVLEMYFGAGYFYGATITAVYGSAEELLRRYE